MYIYIYLLLALIIEEISVQRRSKAATLCTAVATLHYQKLLLVEQMQIKAESVTTTDFNGNINTIYCCICCFHMFFMHSMSFLCKC